MRNSREKRCPVYHWKDQKLVLNELKYLAPLSKNVGNYMLATYLCSGDHVHKAHLIRIEDSMEKIMDRTFSIPSEMRERLFPRQEGRYSDRMIKGKLKSVLINEWELRCPIAKAQMTFQKQMTDRFGDPTVDIFHCVGASWGHFAHYAKLQHGKIKLDDKELGILVFTRYVERKRNRIEEKRLEKAELFNVINKVWNKKTKAYQPSTILELVKKKLSSS